MDWFGEKWPETRKIPYRWGEPWFPVDFPFKQTSEVNNGNGGEYYQQ